MGEVGEIGRMAVGECVLLGRFVVRREGCVRFEVQLFFFESNSVCCLCSLPRCIFMLEVSVY